MDGRWILFSWEKVLSLEVVPSIQGKGAQTDILDPIWPNHLPDFHYEACRARSFGSLFKKISKRGSTQLGKGLVTPVGVRDSCNSCISAWGGHGSLAQILKTRQNRRFLGNDAKGNCFAHEEGHNGSFFMKGKHVGFIVEVLQDQGMGSTGTVTKCCITRGHKKNTSSYSA